MSKKYKEPTLVIRGDWIDVYTPYSPSFVADLKSQIPYEDKKPIYENGKFDCWRIRKIHETTIKLIIKSNYREQYVIERGEKLSDDGMDREQRVKVNDLPHVRRFEVWYVGRCKERSETNEPSAFFMNQDQKWVGLIPEDMLRAWFVQDVETADYFRVLGIKASDTDKKVKSAYRAMARQYHPDVYDGDDSTERMKLINEAYSLLKTQQGRKRYKACLWLESKVVGLDAAMTGIRAGNKKTDDKYGYRCPKPNGMIKMNGVEAVGSNGRVLFIAQEILQWDPVIRDGKRLISGYKKRSNVPTRRDFGYRYRRFASYTTSANDYEFVYEWV